MFIIVVRNVGIEQGLSMIESNKLDPEDLKLFVSTTKRFTAFGYMKSEYIMTEIMPYKLIPGTYGSCEIIDNSKRANING